MLPLWLLPLVEPVLALVPDWPAVLLDCAWTAVAPNMAATTEALSRPFSSLFIFMSISLICLRG
jgi:hypothetical protein